MMNVSSLGGTGPIGRIEPRVTQGARENPAASAPSSGSRVQRGEDRVELSGSELYLSKLRELPEIRQDLVDRIKAQIEEGTYDTPDKIDGAIDAFLEELEQGL